MSDYPDPKPPAPSVPDTDPTDAVVQCPPPQILPSLSGNDDAAVKDKDDDGNA